jgi:hypothetical protein
MKYRKLRIAFTAMCGIVCLLFVVLWVRSYKSEDRVSGHLGSVGVRFYSSRGWIICFKNNAIGPGQYPWSIDLGADYWLAPNDSRLRFSSPADFLSGAATSNISMPHWFVIVIATSLAMVPWLRWRFSLRTLLIAMTVIAALLGTIIALSR